MCSSKCQALTFPVLDTFRSSCRGAAARPSRTLVLRSETGFQAHRAAQMWKLLRPFVFRPPEIVSSGPYFYTYGARTILTCREPMQGCSLPSRSDRWSLCLFLITGESAVQVGHDDVVTFLDYYPGDLSSDRIN